MKTEKIIVGAESEYPLNGLLTLPEDVSRPVPAVVFVHGSGSSNMDERVGKLTPFKDLAEGLARYGIASIRYDKRSFAHAFKMVKDKSTVITVKEETIEDAILATRLLKMDDRIDSDRIFIIGHSMGAMLAPRIDAEGGDYKGLVLMAGTPRKLEEILLEQNEEMLEQLSSFLRKLVGKQARKLSDLFSGLYELSDEEAKTKKVGGGTTLYYFKEMGEHDVPSYLAETHKPMLVMQGEKDFQVKADKDFALYQELLKDRADVTFKLYEGLNHAFVPSIYGSITKAKKEYAVEQHIGENVISDIAHWVLSV